MKPWMMLLALVAAASAGAAAPTPDSALPPAELVPGAIEQLPEVHAAEAALARAEADAHLRDIGSHEAQLTVIPQQRRIENGPQYREWEADLSRPVRWPQKARLDREIGAAGVEAAQLMLEDARHGGARRLLRLWSNWQRAEVEARQQHAQVTAWERDHKAIARRVELGDAARRDLVAGDAALAQARATALQADADAQTARLALRSTFPGLPLPDRQRLEAQPPELEGSDTYWTELIIQRSHEIGAADAMLRQRETEARRARADRLPDPTIGLRLLNDLGGRERAVGVIFSMPFGVRQRSARASAAAAEAMAAQAQVAMVRRDVARDARDRVARARAAHAIWASRETALLAARESASKAERAYVLGESSLTELLAARRVALETALAERRAAVDAIEAVALVRVDAHELWHGHSGESDLRRHHTDGIRLPELSH